AVGEVDQVAGHQLLQGQRLEVPAVDVPVGQVANDLIFVAQLQPAQGLPIRPRDDAGRIKGRGFPPAPPVGRAQLGEGPLQRPLRFGFGDRPVPVLPVRFAARNQHREKGKKRRKPRRHAGFHENCTLPETVCHRRRLRLPRCYRVAMAWKGGSWLPCTGWIRQRGAASWIPRPLGERWPLHAASGPSSMPDGSTAQPGRSSRLAPWPVFRVLTAWSLSCYGQSADQLVTKGPVRSGDRGLL